jgi:endonuclease/exonuclease/phosphatase family metal-dependent hydrolase
MRIASYNVENLFDRPRVLKQESWIEGRAVLAAFARLNTLLQHDPYSDEDKAAILGALGELRLLRADQSRYVRLRRIRGALLRRQRDGETIVVARGRSSWIGWIELVTEHVDQLAMRHTAMVIRDVGADVLGVIEAESRTLLEMFSAAMLTKVGGVPYETVMLLNGNDPRGIDVGLMCRPGYPIVSIRSHVYDRDGDGVVFSRDCCEYHLRTPSGETLVVLVNHLKSKGYGSASDPIGNQRRQRQAVRIAEIYQGLLREGARHVAIVGDLNDHPASDALAPLLVDTNLKDISEFPGFEWGSRLGTFRGGNRKDKIDYVLLSPDLFGRVTGGGIFRKGVHRGPRTRDPWEIYPTLTAPVHEASDHAAIYADLDL